MKRLILKEARNAWEAGKKLGFSVKGDEREVVDEIMRLEVHRVPKKLLADIGYSVKLDSVEPPPLGWMKFNVVGVVMEDEVGCGEVLRDDIVVACALFFCAIEVMGSEMAEVIDIKKGLGLFIGMGWPVKVPLVNESSSHVVLEWLLERNYLLWTLRNVFIGIDCGFNQLFRV
ncbi:hypothetical protein PVK06_024749 [Gossypium arboreum]|uniref:Uncharacterized protein n=1 Tax=Gossypium arboreum TaxID=29729 RepID=A0ABR0PEK0_GOSAR|nr:hypothetical protein PVK06_024749 [Gossypium arboreum]